MRTRIIKTLTTSFMGLSLSGVFGMDLPSKGENSNKLIGKMEQIIERVHFKCQGSVELTLLEETIFINKRAKWIPSRLDDIKASQIMSSYLDELLMENNPIYNTPGKDENIDYGVGFETLFLIQELCLQKVCSLYQSTGTRVSVADVGAGLGHMAWKLIVAGARLHAVEKQIPPREILKEKLKLTIPSLADGEKWQQLCTLYWDAMKFDGAFYKNKYDVTWSGNLIHFMNPDQATQYLSKLYEVTNPEGYAFAVVHCPLHNDKIFKYFLEGREEGLLFPGYFIEEWHVTYDIKRIDDEKVDVFSREGEKVFPVTRVCNGETPGKYDRGRFGEEDQWFDVERDGKGYPSVAKKAMCKIVHYFDKQALRGLFERAGFFVEDIFYQTSTARRYDGELTLEMMEQNHYEVSVAIVAKKLA